MAVAKSRLQKVPNVRKLLHNPKGSLSQRFHSAKANVGKKVKQTLSRVKGAFKKPPKKSSSVQMNAVKNIKEMQTKANAVKNIIQLQAAVKKPPPVPPKRSKTPPKITSPSPVSQIMKGPSRPPPPPPSNIPSRPITKAPKIGPKVPPKPNALRANKKR